MIKGIEAFNIENRILSKSQNPRTKPQIFDALGDMVGNFMGTNRSAPSAPNLGFDQGKYDDLTTRRDALVGGFTGDDSYESRAQGRATSATNAMGGLPTAADRTSLVNTGTGIYDTLRGDTGLGGLRTGLTNLGGQQGLGGLESKYGTLGTQFGGFGGTAGTGGQMGTGFAGLQDRAMGMYDQVGAGRDAAIADRQRLLQGQMEVERRGAGAAQQEQQRRMMAQMGESSPEAMAALQAQQNRDLSQGMRADALTARGQARGEVMGEQAQDFGMRGQALGQAGGFLGQRAGMAQQEAGMLDRQQQNMMNRAALLGQRQGVMMDQANLGRMSQDERWRGYDAGRQGAMDKLGFLDAAQGFDTAGAGFRRDALQDVVSRQNAMDQARLSQAGMDFQGDMADFNKPTGFDQAMEVAGTVATVKVAFACIPEGTLIDISEEYKVNIRDIGVGAVIMGFNGKPVTVLQKHEYLEKHEGPDRFLELTFDDESKVNVCDMHRIDGVRSGDYKVGDKVRGREIVDINRYGNVRISYDLLTEDQGYRISGIPVNSMIGEMAEVTTQLLKAA